MEPVTLDERRLRRYAARNPLGEVSFDGLRVHITNEQVILDCPSGDYVCTATVRMTGVRTFGQKVVFRDEPSIAGAPTPEDVAYMEELGRYSVQVFAELDEEGRLPELPPLGEEAGEAPP